MIESSAKPLGWVRLLAGAGLLWKSVNEAVVSYDVGHLQFNYVKAGLYGPFDGPLALFLIVVFAVFGVVLMESASSFIRLG